jgi:hypothetical protein
MRHNPARPFAALVLLLALVGAYVGFDTLMQDLAYTRADTELSFWGRDGYQPTPAAILDTSQILKDLLQSAPHHPDYLELQGRYAAWQAYWTADVPASDVLRREAVASQRGSLLSRPSYRLGWSIMVEYASNASGSEALLQLAQRRLELLESPEY